MMKIQIEAQKNFKKFGKQLGWIIFGVFGQLLDEIVDAAFIISQCQSRSSNSSKL